LPFPRRLNEQICFSPTILDSGYWIATADALLFANVHCAAHWSEVPDLIVHASFLKNTAVHLQLKVTVLLQCQHSSWRLNEPPCQVSTLRSWCSWRGTTITSRQWSLEKEEDNKP